MNEPGGVLRGGRKPNRPTISKLEAIFPRRLSISGACAISWDSMLIIDRKIVPILLRVIHKINRRLFGARYFRNHGGAPRAVVNGRLGAIVLLRGISPAEIPEIAGVAVKGVPRRPVLDEILCAVSDRPSLPEAVTVAMRRSAE